MLLNGNCLEKLKELADNSIDMVLTDPPYGITPCKWDVVIPFEPLWFEIKRILKPAGSVALFGTEPFSSALRMSNPSMYKYDWYWKKCKSLGANFCHAKNAPIRTVETISLFSKAKINHIGKTKNRMNYNPQGLRDCVIKDQGHKHGKVSEFRKYIERPSHKKYDRLKTGYPESVLTIGFQTNERRKRFHPTQKPVALLEYLIKTYTNEGETVLDFTMGSGSTGVAAKNTGRKFIGIELSEEYFEIAKKRIGE